MTGGPGPHVLLVEDDTPTRTSLARDLDARGYRVVVAADGGSALRHWSTERPDVILLDLGLPDIDGLTIIRRVRREAMTPIVILSARHEEATKVEALELGADDFVTKPFAVGELHARMRAVLRRSTGGDEPSGIVRHGTLEFDPLRHEVRVSGAAVELTPREFEILKVLLAHRGRLVTRGRLLRAVWGEAYQAEDHYIHVYVSQIRRKLAKADPDARLRGLIMTEPGVGYRIAEAPEAPS
jgi:two-component system KDP operon response regulator KdpE